MSTNDRPNRIVIDGLPFDDLTIGEATDRIVALAKLRDRPRFVCTGNLDHLAIAAYAARPRAGALFMSRATRVRSC